MSEAAANSDEAILAALNGIVRMQHTIRGGLDLCVETGLTFVRIYYNNLPGNIARRLTELNPVALAAIPGATGVNGSEKARQNIASNVASDAAFAQAIRFLSYLEGTDVSAEEKRQIAESPAFRLVQEAQLLREAVMLRQQREVAEHVRDAIRAEKAIGRPRTGLPPS